MNSSKMLITAAILTITALPTLAQNEISNNQPITRSLSEEEIRIEAKMKLDFKKGLIDSNQLAAMQRDFDGILVREDSFKARGLTDDGRKAINEALARFEEKLDKAAGASTTSEANNASGEKADQNNAGLDKMEPTK
ncbi:MAG: hypothetical protein JST01_13175 [Cyanobacteria bacterium SZAS TMP-1]|nr:hypothetical protein [Cyanobacteria bacterium SZAS TMP-1]